eukprot:scaffold15771_cov27-Tisochrysis_lutea.AAC.7
MVDFASPGELGELRSFQKLFEEIIERGQWKAAAGATGTESAELQVRGYPPPRWPARAPRSHPLLPLVVPRAEASARAF